MSTTTANLDAHHDDHAAHNPHHQHHFATMEQQFDTSKVGMWLFLVTEVLMFGGLFVGFGMMQGRYPLEFVEAHHHLQRWAGSLNTIVLLVSSWTMVMAVHAAETSQNKRLKTFLLLTIACAFIFLGIKYYEYNHKYQDGLLPGRFYNPVQEVIEETPAGLDTHGLATFFAFYFMMTGLHGFHIVIGIVLLSWLYVKASKGHFGSAYYTPVDLIGLYWHIVDMIWIYLFPLYYLIT